MRIDFIMGNETFAESVTSAMIDRDERKGEAPSDHVPVVVDIS
jgi:exodeoxyribonuclease-3